MSQLAPPCSGVAARSTGSPRESVARTQRGCRRTRRSTTHLRGIGHSVSDPELADVAAFIRARSRPPLSARRPAGRGAPRRRRLETRSAQTPGRRHRRRTPGRGPARSSSRSVAVAIRRFSARTAACVARSCTSHCGGATRSALISRWSAGGYAAAGETRVRDAELAATTVRGCGPRDGAPGATGADRR